MDVTFETDTDQGLIEVRVYGEMNPVETSIHFSRLEMLVSEYPTCNILINMLDATLKDEEMNMTRAMDVTSFYKFMGDGVPRRVAAVVPDEEGRLYHARNIESAVQIKGMAYKVFTSVEDAKGWLR